jgi:hypothetical protein
MRWQAVMAPMKGAKVVVSHVPWAYILTRFGLMNDDKGEVIVVERGAT